jgi:hypothetical protein
MRTILLTLGVAVALGACSRQAEQQPGTYGAAAAGGSCAEGVRQLRASPVLGVQGGSDDQTSARAKADVYLLRAADAASRGDEATCRRYLGIASAALLY